MSNGNVATMTPCACLKDSHTSLCSSRVKHLWALCQRQCMVSSPSRVVKTFCTTMGSCRPCLAPWIWRQATKKFARSCSKSRAFSPWNSLLRYHWNRVNCPVTTGMRWCVHWHLSSIPFHSHPVSTHNPVRLASVGCLKHCSQFAMSALARHSAG